jgi:hypothetical protein
MNRILIASGVASLFLMLSLTCNDKNSGFSFSKTDQGIELIEKGKSVLFYQKMPKSLTGEYICNNYIHPLYNLAGDTLTEEFPSDHPYHRGVFWTWHQLYIGTNSLGDGWINDGISLDVVNLFTEEKGDNAEINVEVLWKSDTLPGDKAFMKEKTSVIVHPSEKNIRLIDFRIELIALTENLEIGGSNDPKGYGGFCIRLKTPENMICTSEQGPVIPQELQIPSSRWMDFSGSFGNKTQTNGIAILCHPDNPVFPSTWILRQKGSMQNAVFPGRERIKLSINKPVVLKYRLVIHNNSSQIIDLNKLQTEYI